MAEQGPLSGQILSGKYQLGELLGQGGFGAVYKAQNLRLNRPQAIKVIVEQHLRNQQFRERFDREAQVLGSLDHPNILHVDDYEIENNRAYLVMPYIGGGTFRDILKRQGQLSLEQTGDYVRQISAALDYAHAHHVVHLDLKPLNLLHQNGTLFLSDFGLAHLMNEGGVAGGSSLRFGTPLYIAPEQYKGSPLPASDIYALGVILFQMLAGRLPFEGPGDYQVIYQHLEKPVPLLSLTRTDIPQAIDMVIQRAMAKKPGERYASAGELFNDFKAKAVLSAPALPLTRTGPEFQSVSLPVVPSPQLSSWPSEENTPAAGQPISASRDLSSGEPSLPRFSDSLAQHSQLKLDVLPSLDAVNYILQEVAKQIKAKK